MRERATGSRERGKVAKLLVGGVTDRPLGELSRVRRGLKTGLTCLTGAEDGLQTREYKARW